MKSPVNKRIILASNSPRRRELLAMLIPIFEIAPVRDIDESFPPETPPEEVAPYVSYKKACGYSDLVNDSSLLITADTVVIVEGKILGKPHSFDEAVTMLKHLSGRSHKVVTGVTLTTDKMTKTFSCVTKVHFDNVPDDEILQYVEEYEPYDKAGAYGIQEWIGCRGIKSVEGCFYNVMGLPVNKLYNELKALQNERTDS